jgi:hypothetical protein
MGIETTNEAILNARVDKMHFAKNFISTDETTFKAFFKLLKSYFHLILQNHFYMGFQVFKHPNGKVEVKSHIYPPLVSREVYNQCQYVMKKLNFC